MKLTIQIASLPHREKVVAEILAESNNVAEVFYADDNKLGIEIYAPKSSEFWTFSYDEFVDALERAKTRLITGE
jgi:hypothetical protein